MFVLGGSALQDGVETVNKLFKLYLETSMTWEGFSQNDIDLYLPAAAEDFEQHLRRHFGMARGSCKVNFRHRQLNNPRMCIKRGVMEIDR